MDHRRKVLRLLDLLVLCSVDLEANPDIRTVGHLRAAGLIEFENTGLGVRPTHAGRVFLDTIEVFVQKICAGDESVTLRAEMVPDPGAAEQRRSERED